MIQYFYKPYSIKSCYKILVIFPVLYISMVSNLFSTGTSVMEDKFSMDGEEVGDSG